MLKFTENASDTLKQTFSSMKKAPMQYTWPIWIMKPTIIAYRGQLMKQWTLMETIMIYLNKKIQS